jgi:hypothetical protein
MLLIQILILLNVVCLILNLYIHFFHLLCVWDIVKTLIFSRFFFFLEDAFYWPIEYGLNFYFILFSG